MKKEVKRSFQKMQKRQLIKFSIVTLKQQQQLWIRGWSNAEPLRALLQKDLSSVPTLTWWFTTI